MSEQKLLKLTVSKVDAPVFDGDVLSVHEPGAEGEMEVLADHEALISPLKSGVLTINKAGEEKVKMEIEGGILEISNNHATVLI